MHMSDALISPAVGGAMWAASAISVAVAVRRTSKSKGLSLPEDGIAPMMGVAGAFVFAAQMLNFSIPGTGSSGHITGALLLCALLGPMPTLLTMAVILGVQALIFADGGLLAYGCNLFNMGVLPCFIAYPLIFKPILGKTASKARIGAASVIASVVGLQLGAFCVTLETLFSGMTSLPFSAFAALMQPIHLAIGLTEGAATAALLLFLRAVAPSCLGFLAAADFSVPQKRGALVRPIVIFAVLAVISGALLSHLASGDPDGLEWSVENVGAAELLEEETPAVQRTTAILPDYGFSEGGGAAGLSVSGLVGGGVTLVAAAGIGLLLFLPRKKRVVG